MVTELSFVARWSSIIRSNLAANAEVEKNVRIRFSRLQVSMISKVVRVDPGITRLSPMVFYSVRTAIQI